MRRAEGHEVVETDKFQCLEVCKRHAKEFELFFLKAEDI